MKTRMIVFVLCFVLLLGFTGCNSSADQSPSTEVPESTAVPTKAPAPTQTPAPEPTVDPAVAIVMEYVARVNAEDYAAAAEFFADDSMAYLVGMPPVGMEIFWGKEQYETFLKECCTDQHFEMAVTPMRVEDNVVYAEAKTWMDFTRALGVAPNSFHEVFLKDGKIALYSSTMTEEALANFKPAMREVMPELFDVALPAGESAVSEIDVAITGDTCAYAGPMTLQAGELTVNLTVADHRFDRYALSLFALDESKDLLDLMASTYSDGPPSWAHSVLMKELGSGESQTYSGIMIDEGLLYMVCWAGPPDTPIGNAGPFVVQP